MLAPDSVSVFAPTLVREAPITTPLKLTLPVPPMDDAGPRSTVPLYDAAVALLLTSAPVLLMPVPLKLRKLATLWP